MNDIIQLLSPLISAVLASSGLWAYIQKNSDKKDTEKKMLMGLAHNAIVHSAYIYIERGWISQDEYDDFYDCLYLPYTMLGGKPPADRIMKEIDALPIRNHIPSKEDLECR